MVSKELIDRIVRVIFLILFMLFNVFFSDFFFFWGGSIYVAYRISVLLPDIEAGPQPGILTSRPPGNFLFQIFIANKYFYQIEIKPTTLYIT